MIRDVVTVPPGLRIHYVRCFRQAGAMRAAFGVPGCGHFIPEEQPAAVVRAVPEFAGSTA